MHDGRFVSLDEVLNHYAGGMQHSGTIDPVFVREDNKLGISLSPDDRSAIKAFLQTLNDSAFVRNPAFAEPGSVRKHSQ
jgi:cytochrome c peroxidase